MNKVEFFEFQRRFHEKCMKMVKAKNSDYSGASADPFLNFKSVEKLGVKTEDGFLTRMNDKIMRISGFVQNGTLQVMNESVTDTLQDLASYCCLMAAYIESEK